MKTCLICEALLPSDFFAPLKTGRDGLHPWCRECVSEYNKSRYRNGQADRPVVRRSTAKILPYVDPPKDKVAKARQEQGYISASTVWRKLLKKNCVPSWVEFRDTVPIYALATSLGFAVDHIVPIHGKDVCGLHVPWNLQLLTPSENSRKGTKYVQPF